MLEWTAATISEMAAAYIAAIRFTESNGDSTFDQAPCSTVLLEQATREVHAFAVLAWRLCSAYDIKADWQQVAHDFWLTRNRHGAGFWDRPEYYHSLWLAERLTTLAQACGEQDVCLGEDGYLYLN